MADEFEIREETKRVWIGADGAEFDTEKEALWSHVRRKLTELLGDAGGYYDPDYGDVADALREHKEDIIRWLTLV